MEISGDLIVSSTILRYTLYLSSIYKVMHKRQDNFLQYQRWKNHCFLSKYWIKFNKRHILKNVKIFSNL